MKPVAVIVVLTVLLIGLLCWGYTSYGLMNIFTGSTKYYDKWAFGIKTNHVYRNSELEKRLRTINGVVIDEKWISFAGTRKVIGGMVLSRGHGNPGAIMMMNDDVMKMWLPKHSDADVIALYDVLKTNDQHKIRLLLDKIVLEVYPD